MALRLVWKTSGPRQSDVAHVFLSEKRWNFVFLQLCIYNCVYEPNCGNFWFCGHIYFAKRFLFVLQKNLRKSRLQVFSTFRFLIFCLSIWTKYMNPKLMSRWLYAGEDLTEKSGQTDRQTNTQTNPRTSFFRRLPHKSPSGNNNLRSKVLPKCINSAFWKELDRINMIARRAFVWHTFKKWCPSVCGSVGPDFSGKSSLTYSERDIDFGFIYLGKISRSEKSKIQNAFRYLAIVTTSSFFEEKIKNVLRTKYDLKIINFNNWVHIHSVKTKIFNFLRMKTHDPRQINVTQTSSTQKAWGPPCPGGVS